MQFILPNILKFNYGACFVGEMNAEPELQQNIGKNNANGTQVDTKTNVGWSAMPVKYGKAPRLTGEVT